MVGDLESMDRGEEGGSEGGGSERSEIDESDEVSGSIVWGRSMTIMRK